MDFSMGNLDFLTFISLPFLASLSSIFRYRTISISQVWILYKRAELSLIRFYLTHQKISSLSKSRDILLRSQ